jgi:hypothetical protein
MKLFTSKRERRLWFCVLAVVVTIYATLGLTQPQVGFLGEKGLLSLVFLLGVALFVTAVLVHGFRTRPRGADIGVMIGMLAVFLLVMIRIELPEERSYLIEYGVVGLLFFEALRERANQRGKGTPPALVAILLTGFFGLIDENVQYLIPDRVFDSQDILFNLLAGTITILTSLVLTWARQRFSSRKA